MFRIVIKRVIEILDVVLNELKRAYSETYELSDLSKEFIERVKEIKRNNKKSFLKAAEAIEFQKSAFTLEWASLREIKQRALRRWKEALGSGDLDELYNVKERSNND